MFAALASALLLSLLPGSARAGADLAAPIDAAALQGDWRARRPLVEELGRIPVELEPADLALVAEGGIARHRLRQAGMDRVLGATWTDLPRDQLWIAILDDSCFTLVEGLTERHLPSGDPLRKLLFQHVDAPWPFSDRQWILDIRSNPGLYAASAGAIWERTWTLASGPEGAPERIPDPAWPDPQAIWTPVNDGGWLLLDAAGGTLLVYHARVDVGGALPDEASTAWALATLKGLLSKVLERAAVIASHYDGSHAPVLRPDGSPIPGGR